MPKQLQLPTKSQREHDTDLCQEMPTTGPPALASCSFASSRRVLSRRRLHIVCLTSCQVYIQNHTVPGIHLLRSLRVSTIAISICILSPAAAISPPLPGPQRYSVDGTISCVRYLIWCMLAASDSARKVCLMQQSSQRFKLG